MPAEPAGFFLAIPSPSGGRGVTIALALLPPLAVSPLPLIVWLRATPACAWGTGCLGRANFAKPAKLIVWTGRLKHPPMGAKCLPILLDTDEVWSFDQRMGARQVDESEPERRSLQGPRFGDPVGRRTGNGGVAVVFPDFNGRRTISLPPRAGKPQPASFISNPLCLWPTNGARVLLLFLARRNLLPGAVPGPGPCTDQQ